ncbi:MAG: type II secretion system protein [Candidatus Aminicenantes bacterium]|nr:type II secretion system protein [Candidatus Aminicenantes bacterium]
MRRGFTFIEVLVSLAIVAFLSAGLAEMVIQALAAKARADRVAAMTALAVEKLELLKTLPPDDDALKEGRYEETARTGTSPLPYRLAWSIEDGGQGTLRIEISVAPEPAGIRAKPVRAVLYLSGALGFQP